MTETVRAAADGIAWAAAMLAAGECVVFPTETVYGLGADATDDAAVARIFEIKERPSFNPLIVHVVDAEAARPLVRWNDAAAALAERFWPGPLTFVLPRAADCPVSLLASAGLDTLALRAPDHPVAQALLDAAGRPLAAPSANVSGHVSPTTAAHAAEELDDKVGLVLDGGPCRVGVESTIIDLTAAQPAILRPGGIAAEDLHRVIGGLATATPGGAVKAPGMTERHYAPRTPLRLDAMEAGPGECLLGFGPGAPAATANLSASGDLAEAAANLFAMLRALDAQAPVAIAVMPIPEEGLGVAINDRLRRGAVSA